MSERHRVVIIGGGFGGLACVRKLRRANADLLLLDRHNYHLFQPLLYQVATGELSPANIASPLRAILAAQKNCQVLLGEVTGFDVEQRRVLLNNQQIPYDTLVVATGSTHHYFGHDEWATHAPGLKSLEQATDIRRRILYAFEAAEAEENLECRRDWLTFVIVGAGPTGVELAGALSEIAYHMLKREFRRIDPSETRILLVEAGPRALAMYPERLSNKAQQDLERLKIEVRTAARVTNVTGEQVTFEQQGETVVVPCRTVIWAAGVAASGLGRELAKSTGVELDKAGRVNVQPDLTIPGHPEVFVIGDLAGVKSEAGKPLPALAPVAMQQGDYVARLIVQRLVGQNTSATKPFRYRDRGSMAVIGRYSAVAVIGQRQWSGVVAWLIWLFIHLMEITQFRNRLLVILQWGWTYLTHDRAARLITGPLPSEGLNSSGPTPSPDQVADARATAGHAG